MNFYFLSLVGSNNHEQICNYLNFLILHIDRDATASFLHDINMYLGCVSSELQDISPHLCHRAFEVNK